MLGSLKSRINAKRKVAYVAVVIMVVFVALITLRREPTYQGKTVRSWVWEYAKTNQQGFHPPPTAAVREMGPEAVQLLASELRRQNPVSHHLRFRIWNSGPNWVRKRMQDPYDVPDAYLTRVSAAIILGDLGPEARSAIPDLRASLKDSTPHVHLHAAYAMWQIDHDLASEVVPILLELHTNQYNFKYYTSLYFGNIGSDAKAAVPLLRETLNDPNWNIRANAKTALQKIELADSKATELQ